VGRREEDWRELHRIGVNVNQVAHAANRGRVDLVRGHWESLTELRRALPGVRMLLLQIIRERRRRGVEPFRKQGRRPERRGPMAERHGVAGTVLEELEIAKPQSGRLRAGAAPGRRGRKVARGPTCGGSFTTSRPMSVAVSGTAAVPR